MPSRPHLRWPLQLAPDGTIAVVEQDTDDNIASCIAAIISWPLGTNDLNPDFGIPEQAFRQDGPDLDQIRQGILASEDRALIAVTETDFDLGAFVSNVQAGFDPLTPRPPAQ